MGKGDIAERVETGGQSALDRDLSAPATGKTEIVEPAVMPLKVVKMSDVKPEKVDWLWPSWIPRGMVTILDGDPGLGKSTLVCEIAACLSMQRALPGQVQPVHTTVLLLNAEDAAGCTIRPRLDAAGADTARVLTLEDPLVSIPGCLPQIEATIQRQGVGLVVFDPLMAFLGADINSHKDQDVRRALSPLAAMAARRNVAVLLVRHLNKSLGGSAIYRGGGSIGIIGAARAGLLLGRDPDNPELRILANTKPNLAPKARALRFALVSVGDVARIDWRGTCDLNADDLCAMPDPDASPGALADAKEFLCEFLSDGEKATKDVYQTAQEQKVSERTLRRAARDLGIARGKVWALPAARMKTAADVGASP